jgi:hypothetical protein
MERRRTYIDPSVPGGRFAPEFNRPVPSDITAAEIERPPEKARALQEVL